MVAETEPTLIPSSELTKAIGTRLGPSTWHVVDQERVNGFADATEDRQWIHLDAKRAAETPFGGTVAHGYLTLALAPALLDEIVTVENSGMVINYGANKVRFPAPLRVGSRVRMSAELASATESKDGSVQVVFGLAFEAEGNEKPCCIAEIIFRYYPQESPRTITPEASRAITTERAR